MAEKVTMDYFWGQDVPMSQFYRVPKSLYTSEYFRDICFEAKAIYGMMVDRVGLSIKNGWQDQDGRTYIRYSQAEIMADTGCKKNMVIKAMKQLEEIGLISRVKQGQGHSDIIYVKNFEMEEKDEAENGEDGLQDQYAPARSLKIKPLEVQNSNIKKSENGTSRSAESKLLEVQKPNPNDIYKNYTDVNNTNPIISIKEDSMDGMEEYQAYLEIVKENIEYEALLERHPYEADIVNGILDLILETVISKKDSILVSGQNYPAALVKSKFLKLNYSNIEYVISCMGKNTTKVRNIKGYLLTALFNAGSTMGSYYKAEVNHDLPQFAG